MVRARRGPEVENWEGIVATCVGTRRPDVEEYFVAVEVLLVCYPEERRAAYHVHSEAIGVTSKGSMIGNRSRWYTWRKVRTEWRRGDRSVAGGMYCVFQLT